MFNLFRASLYKLFREKTFLITMIIGTAMAIFIPLIYKLLDLVSGQAMLLSSTAPGSNFGLTVPINLAVLVVAEFTAGTLRNKIIAGYRKSFIYLSLVFSGIVFTFIMMIYYIGISVALGSILGGFDATILGGAKFIVPYLVIALLTYVFVACLSIFVASNLRTIGASLPILIITLTALSLMPLFLSMENANIELLSWLVPGFVVNLYSSIMSQAMSAGAGMLQMTDMVMAGGIVCPVIYSTIFVVLGMILMMHRDVK